MRHIGLAVLAFALLLMFLLPLAAQTGYVANSASAGFVSFIDGATNSILSGPIQDVLVMHQPTYLVLSPDGTRLYVSNQECNYPDTFQGCVSVIRTDALATSPTVNIPVGDFPRGIAITPDGTLLYVVNGFQTISVISTSTNTVIATLTNIQAHGEIVMSLDGTRAYVPGWCCVTGPLNAEGVTVIDTTTNTVAGHLVGLPSGDPIYGIAITPDGRHLYVANGNIVDANFNYVGSNTVGAIDIASNTLLATITVAPQPWDIAISPDGSKAYVAGFDPNGAYGTLTVIDTVTNNVLTAISTDCCLSVPAITPDGSKVFVSNDRFGSYGIEVFSTATNTLVANLTNTFLYPTQFNYPYGIAFAKSQTPAQMVLNLIAQLSSPSLGLTKGQINNITTKLNNVSVSIQQGQKKQAINQLNALISSVQTDQKTGRMTASTANTLITAANAIFARLQ